MINRLNDIYFKYLLGSEQYKDLTLSFINAILDRTQENRFTDLKFLKESQQPEHEDGKLTIVDILTETSDGMKVNIEMQVGKQKHFIERFLFYLCRAYVSSLQGADGYEKLKPVIGIGLCNFSIIDQVPDYTIPGIFDNPLTGAPLTDKIQMKLIELPKFKLKDFAHMTMSEKWIYYFASNMLDQERSEPEMCEDATFQKVLEAERKFHNTSEYQYYLAKEKQMRDERARLEYAEEEATKLGYKKGLEKGLEKGMAEGIAQGIEKGMARGLEEGIEKGIEKGIEEGQNKMIRNLLAMNLPISNIAQASGKTEAEILEIKNLME